MAHLIFFFSLTEALLKLGKKQTCLIQVTSVSAGLWSVTLHLRSPLLHLHNNPCTEESLKLNHLQEFLFQQEGHRGTVRESGLW